MSLDHARPGPVELIDGPELAKNAGPGSVGAGRQGYGCAIHLATSNTDSRAHADETCSCARADAAIAASKSESDIYVEC